MANFPIRMQVTEVELQFGPRGGLRSKAKHHVISKGGNLAPDVMLRYSGGKHVITGFKAFLFLVNYAVRYPAQNVNITKLYVDGVTNIRAGQIQRYFENHRRGDYALSGVTELSIKGFNRRRATVFHPVFDPRRNRIPVNMNRPNDPILNGQVAANDIGGMLFVTGMEDFIRLVSIASKLPSYTQTAKRMVVKDMGRRDFLDVQAFFTELEAGMFCFPHLVQLVNKAGW